MKVSERVIYSFLQIKKVCLTILQSPSTLGPSFQIPLFRCSTVRQEKFTHAVHQLSLRRDFTTMAPDRACHWSPLFWIQTTSLHRMFQSRAISKRKNACFGQ